MLEARAALAGCSAMPARAVDSVEVAADSAPAASMLASAWARIRRRRMALTRRPEIGSRAGRVRHRRSRSAARGGEAVSRPGPRARVHLGSGGAALDAGARAAQPVRLPESRRRSTRRTRPGRLRPPGSPRCRRRCSRTSSSPPSRCRGVDPRAHGRRLAVVTAAERAAALARAAYARGETSRLEPALADLTSVRAERARAAADARARSAGQALEAAAGVWGTAGSARWPDPRNDELTEGGSP